MNYTKYRDFKKSKLNTVLDLLTPVFYFIMFGLLVIYGVLFFVFIGASMWHRYKSIDNAFTTYIETEMSNTKFYADTYEDGKLYGRFSLSLEVSEDFDFSNRCDYTIDKLMCDGLEIVPVDNKYPITLGNHEIILYISIELPLDDYNNCRRIGFEYDADELIVSDFFMPIEDTSSKSQELIFADSTGKFVLELNRTIIYKLLVIMFIFANCYCLFIIVKAIVLKIKIKQEIKLETESKEL